MDEPLDDYPVKGTALLFGALAEWQKEHSVVKKDADGRFKYASLEVVTHYVSSAAAHGLSHFFQCTGQPPLTEDGPSRTEITAYLVHTGGGYICSSLVVDDYNPKNSQDRNQQRGSALTYSRRYLLGLLYGIATGDKDLDAEIAEIPKVALQQKPKKVAAAVKTKEPAPDSPLISPNHKEGIVVRVAPMETEEREELMLAFKQAFGIRCNETRSNPKGIPSREHITTKEHGDWFDSQLAARAERLKQELKESK